MIKKMLILPLVAVLVFLLSGCGTRVTEADRIANTTIDIGKSELFSTEDRKSAVQWILDKWSKEKTITKLYSITYVGDARSTAEQAYYFGTDNLSHEEMIVFNIHFHSAKGAGSEGFNGDSDYDGFAQVLGRDNGGEWVFVTGGYG
ncbi:MAG: hypothetical protein IJR70_04460 [Eubacterium sp.]|nr:hypothetical protein [Eubacterium sp.]